MDRRIWSRDEFILVMNLYTKIRYGQFNARNAEVIRLAKLLNRTPGAVAYKLVHFSGLDPYHKKRGLQGLANPGNHAIEIYNEFRNNWDEMLFESEVLLTTYENKTLEEAFLKPEEVGTLNIDILSSKQGIDVQRLIKTRINQTLFRKVIINNYSNTCAVCGLNIESLLVASHIIKWSDNQIQRLNPENGICLCSIHDKAFEIGFIGIRNDYKIILSTELSKIKDIETFNGLFKRHENKSIILPDKFYPNLSFLEQHMDSVFKS
jgi:putative restriction endonuclease